MRSLKILDCTLRDGGCVNNFNFGQEDMLQILEGVEASEIDIIECGYIDSEEGAEWGRTKFCNERVIGSTLLKTKKENVEYVAMIDYGKYDVANLEERQKAGIDGIRLAFHKKDRTKIVEAGKTIIEKGYSLYLQPMLTLRYSDKELIELIEVVNEMLPNTTAFYLVDSFGEMRPNDMNRLIYLVEHNLEKSIKLGFHSHNNLQLSYSNAITFINFPSDRELIVDTSIMGMGKGAGNLNSELFAEHLNIYYGKCYKIEPLLEVIDKVLNQIRAEYYWGYSVEFYLSAICHCSPSYAAHFYNKHMLSIKQVSELLDMLSEDKKNSFDKKYADAVYVQYCEKYYDDTQTFERLMEEFAGKSILLIAPGKNLFDADEKIKSLLNDKKVCSISLNNYTSYNSDYVFATKESIFKEILKDKRKIIVTSNVCQEEKDDIYILDYKKWMQDQEEAKDISIVYVMNLLEKCKVKDVYMAGFDGFSANINDNYYDKSLRKPVSIEEAARRNQYITDFLKEKRKKLNVIFLTKSGYDC